MVTDHKHYPLCWQETHDDTCYEWQIKELEREIWSLTTFMSKTQLTLRETVGALQRVDSEIDRRYQIRQLRSMASGKQADTT